MAALPPPPPPLMGGLMAQQQAAGVAAAAGAGGLSLEALQCALSVINEGIAVVDPSLPDAPMVRAACC